MRLRLGKSLIYLNKKDIGVENERAESPRGVQAF